MDVTTSSKTLSASILRTLLYYDIFSYPLTAAEVYRFLPTNGVTEDEVTKELEDLAADSIIYQLGTFFSVRNSPDLSGRRLKGNTLANALMDKARRRARLIGRFPFVLAVMVSGSLSKGFMDEKSDVDFFVVTEPGRLWTARTLLVIFKRVFLGNSHKYFCVNYFLDTEHLEIEEKNLFTATELATLVPMVNANVYNSLMARNPWLRSFFPNYQPRATASVLPVSRSGLKRFAEGIIATLFPRRLEQFLKEKTLSRWKRHYEKECGKADFEIAFKSKDHVSKNHPRNYQRTVIERYEAKLASAQHLAALKDQV